MCPKSHNKMLKCVVVAYIQQLKLEIYQQQVSMDLFSVCFKYNLYIANSSIVYFSDDDDDLPNSITSQIILVLSFLSQRVLFPIFLPQYQALNTQKNLKRAQGEQKNMNNFDEETKTQRRVKCLKIT